MQASVAAGLDTTFPYNPKQGFYILWDFVLGHPLSFEAIKSMSVVSSRRITQPSYHDIKLAFASPGIDPSVKNTLLQHTQHIPNVEADPSALVIFQLQGQRVSTPGTKGHLMPIGWSMCDLFPLGNKLKVGAW